MKRALWVAAIGLVGAGAAATFASAATLGGVSGGDIDTAYGSVTPAFLVSDHFESVAPTPLGGTSMLLSPTGAPGDLGFANSPTWVASAGWLVDGHLAQATGVGTKVAYFPFTGQNGYVATNFEVFALNASAGVVIGYDPAGETGVALLVQRTGSTWTIHIGTIAGGVFTESGQAALPLGHNERPTRGELKARIQDGQVIGSYAGVDYVSRAVTAGTAAGLISLTPNVAVGFHYVDAAKTP